MALPLCPVRLPPLAPVNSSQSTVASIHARAAGVDTWSPCWYVDPESTAARAMDALATQPTRRGRMIPEKIGSYRVGWFPAQQLVYAEGHPGGDGHLARAGELEDAMHDLRSNLADHGVQLPEGNARDLWQPPERRPGLAGLRRLDLTVDLAVDRGVDGVALLAGMAALTAPRLQSQTTRERSGRAVETVSWMGSRGIVARMYDKGVESGSTARGEHLRLEAQLRYRSGERLDPASLNAHHVRGRFVERFQPLWQATKGVSVIGTLAAPQRLHELVQQGRITHAQAKRLTGHLVFEAMGLNAGEARRTHYRHRAELRELGLVPADGVLEPVDVDVSAVLEACMDAETWGTD